MNQHDRHPVAAPPSALLRGHAPAPSTAAVVAEVRSDASIKFDPQTAPAFLTLPRNGFGALLLWRFALPWSKAQEVQTWLTGPSPVNPITREAELRDFFNGMTIPPVGGGAPTSFLHYIGTFLSADLAYASYTLAVGMHVPVPRQQYQEVWMEQLDGLKKTAPAWYNDLIQFLRLCLDPATISEEFAQLASNVGDLTQNAANHPMITRLLAP